jgi:hypothetical protein
VLESELAELHGAANAPPCRRQCRTSPKPLSPAADASLSQRDYIAAGSASAIPRAHAPQRAGAAASRRGQRASRASRRQSHIPILKSRFRHTRSRGAVGKADCGPRPAARAIPASAVAGQSRMEPRQSPRLNVSPGGFGGQDEPPQRSRPPPWPSKKPRRRMIGTIRV